MKQLIILVGPPGSGKSTLAKNGVDYPGYLYINQDSQGKSEHYIRFANAIADRQNMAKGEAWTAAHKDQYTPDRK